MPIKYSSYENVSEEHIKMFEAFWEAVTPKLPEIITNIQDEDNVKASVFNIWLNYANFTQFLFLKRERQMLHAYDEYLIKRMNTYIWKNEKLEKLFKNKQQSQEFLFIFAYLLTLELFKCLEDFSQQHAILRNINLSKFPYYYWSDHDIDQNAEIYVVMKLLISEFLNQYLSEERVGAISTRIYRALADVLD